MRVIAINGGPRRGWNTDTLLKNMLDGAASKGAATEMVNLYDLQYKGCVSCLACKRRIEPRPSRCALHDNLTPVLDKVHSSDAFILGSPVYFSEITGFARAFLERLLFQYLNYDNYNNPLSPRKKTALVFTMNVTEDKLKDFMYDTLFERYENWMKHYFGACETLLCTDTLQVKNYDRYHLGMFDANSKQLRYDTVFPRDCQKAYEIGVRLAENG